MKKLILLLAAVALATSVWAQDTPKKPSFAGFVSNGFWDNWEITLGGGAGTALSNGTNQGVSATVLISRPTSALPNGSIR